MRQTQHMFWKLTLGDYKSLIKRGDKMKWRLNTDGKLKLARPRLFYTGHPRGEKL